MELSSLRSLRPPPLWTYGVLVVAPVVAFALAFPFGLDVLPDVVIEGFYLLVAALIVVPVRRLEIGALEVGWQVFVLGRLVDFLDELFVEPEPLVEPYFSGLLMVVSLSVTLAGAYALLGERSDRIERLEERNAELALKDEAMNAAPFGITIADMTAPDEPLTYANEGFATLTGYDVEKAVGENCRYLQGDETDPETVSRMREAIAADDPVQVTVRNYRRDGTEFWNEVTLAPVEGNDGPTEHYVGFQQDVTDRERYRRRLERQRDDLHLLNEMVRHDIRNDLQLVVANAQMVDASGEAADRVEAIRESTRDAIALTETARDLSEALLSETADQEPVSLERSVRREVDEAQSAFEDATFSVEEPLPKVTVMADEMLDSVFRNLLANAVQHNDTPVPEVNVSVTTEGDCAVVRVADNGPGVPDDVDDVFAREEKGLDSDGTGIGTYLVDRLVSRYGGEVWVEPNDPTGSVFTVSLPRVE